jgi:hypothetical protein
MGTGLAAVDEENVVAVQRLQHQIRAEAQLVRAEVR